MLGEKKNGKGEARAQTEIISLALPVVDRGDCPWSPH